MRPFEPDSVKFSPNRVKEGVNPSQLKLKLERIDSADSPFESDRPKTRKPSIPKKQRILEINNRRMSLANELSRHNNDDAFFSNDEFANNDDPFLIPENDDEDFSPKQTPR